MSSTCVEPEGSSSGRWLYVQLWYGTFYIHRHNTPAPTCFGPYCPIIRDHTIVQNSCV